MTTIDRTYSCKQCMSVVQTIHNFIENNSARFVVELSLDMLCDYVPTPILKEVCQKYVVKNGMKIFDDIMRGLKPRKVFQILICDTFSRCL